MPQPLYLLAGALYAPVAAAKRQRSVGMEHVPAGGCVVAANHVSNIDPFALAWTLFPRRQVRFMAKAELFNPYLGWAMRGIGTFPVRRGAADTHALRTALALLRGGGIVGMFPEGTRRRKGLRKRFAPVPHAGTAQIALNAGVPLIPAGISGTDRLLGRGRIAVAFGPPVATDDLAGLPRKLASRIATDRLMAAIEELVAALERG